MEAEAQKDLNIQRFSTPYDKNKKVPLNMMDCEVLIEEGELLMGIIDKNSIGNTKSGGITHVLMNDRGPDAAKAFLGLNQRMVNYWLMNRGFSVGLGDMVPTPETMNEVMDLIAKAKRKVTSLIQQGQHKQLEKQPGKTIEQYFEWSVNSELNTMANQTQKTIMKHLKSDNSLQAMAVARVPTTMSSAVTVEKRLARKQPRVTPTASTGSNQHRTISASERRNWTRP